ncbi:MAG: hypothetical protein ACLUFW_06300 [Alistipes sp.]
MESGEKNRTNAYAKIRAGLNEGKLTIDEKQIITLTQKRGFDLSVGIVLCMRLYRRLYTNHNFMQEKPPLLAVFPPITIKTADNYEKQIGCKS